MKKFIIVFGLMTIGCLQMAGDLFQNPTLLGIGRATNASPAPKVFTTQKGYETFSARFYIQYVNQNNDLQTIEINPKNYQNLQGPYNRRNMYGATLSYAPVLLQNPKTDSMVKQIILYALQKDALFLKELGITDANFNYPIKLIIKPHKESNPFQLSIKEGQFHD